MDFDSDKTLFLIDGSSFLYRAYYGLRPMHTKKGEPVQAVYGFCRMIKKMIDQFSPKHFVLVWDSKGKTTRHDMFQDYKATRQAPPSDLFEQKELIVKFADLIGLHQIAQQGIEADDLLYSLAKGWAAQDGKAVIITSDKDMGQAITDNIVMYDSFKDVVIDIPTFEQKMEFPVSKTPFYFSLLGDSSDNIPGVKGVGKKGALELVQQFDSLEHLYQNLDQVVKNRARKALEEQRENAFLSLKLFLLQDIDMNWTNEDVAFAQSNWSNAREFFMGLEFTSMLRGLAPQKEQKTPPKTSADKGYIFVTVTTQEQLQQVCTELDGVDIFAYDTETDDVRTLQSNMVGISICTKEKLSYYIPCAHQTGEQQLSRDTVVATLKPYLEDPNKKIIAQNAKFDALVLWRYGVKVQGLFFDTMIAASLVKDEWQRVSLKALSEHYLQEPMLNFSDMVDGKTRKTFADVPIIEATEYAASDAHQTLRLYPILQKLLVEKDVEKIFYELEIPVSDILTQIEARGIFCDTNDLGTLDQVVSKELAALKQTILGLIDEQFENINLNSSQQVGILLFESLQLPPQKKSAKGLSYSTDAEVLKSLAKKHPVPGYIAQYRELFKLKSTYIDALPHSINPNTQRIHTSYSQIRVATGRLASSEPNLQNIPVDGVGINIRAAFKPQEPGKILMSADYSQIELRVLAHFSQDPTLLAAFNEGRDIHAQTAAGLFDTDLEYVTKQMRNVGKRINFSILYGLTPYGLAKDLDIPLKDAKKYIDTYFAQYPKVREWMDEVIAFAKEHGYVKTMMGRRRYLSGIHERNKNMYELACRVAVNTVAQGTAAEIMKLGMLSVQDALQKSNLDAQILLQIHDELLLELKNGEQDEVKQIVTDCLESVVAWNVPLEVSVSTGQNWKEVK